MNPNNVSVSETVLARLDAALDLATAEIASSGTAERRLRGLISRLLNDEARRDAEITVVPLPEPCRDHPANDNPVQHVSGVHLRYLTA
jgi:hypothetical protein